MADDELTTPQQRAIAALLSTKSVAEAAKQAKVAERTLFRWLAEPEFKRQLGIAERELVSTATRRLLQYQDAAITTIVSIMADRQYSAGVRLRAATTVIDTMLRLRELFDLEERLSTLEAKIANQNQ